MYTKECNGFSKKNTTIWNKLYSPCWCIKVNKNTLRPADKDSFPLHYISCCRLHTDPLFRVLFHAIERRARGWLKVYGGGGQLYNDGTLAILKAERAFVPLAFLRNEIISCPSPSFFPLQSSAHFVVGDPLLDRMFKRWVSLSRTDSDCCLGEPFIFRDDIPCWDLLCP